MSTTRETVEAAVQSTSPTTTAELAKFTGICRSSLNRALNKLATEGRIETLPDTNPIEWITTETPVSKAPVPVTNGEDKGKRSAFKGVFVDENAMHVINVEDISAETIADAAATHTFDVWDSPAGADFASIPTPVMSGEDSDWIHRAAETTKLSDDIEAAFVVLEEAYSQKPAAIDDMERKQLVLARLASTVDPVIAVILHQISDDLLAVSGKQQ